MTPNAVSAACRASLAIAALAPRRAVSARKIGMMPGGSMITKSVR